MKPRTTRLEYSIVAVALLVLLFCSKPPRPGTAGVNDLEESLSTPVEPVDEMPSTDTPVEVNDQTPAEEDLSLTTSDFEVREESDDQRTAPTESLFDSSTPAPLPIPKITGDRNPDRITSPRRTPVDVRLVDPRTLPQRPRQEDKTQGEIRVSMVWNGKEYVMKKVRVVKDADGVTKVYSIDDEETK